MLHTYVARNGRRLRRRRTAGAEMQHGVVIWAAVFAVVAAAASGLFALSSPGGWTDRVGVGVTAAVLFMASCAVGGVLGLVFALPRARFTDQASGTGGAHDTPGWASHYLANTNLLKVSDWLTTILIGLGLVQLGRIVPAVGGLASVLEDPLGGGANAGAFGVAAVITSVIVGAVLTYLWTGVRVRELFEESERACTRLAAERATTRKRVEAAEESVGGGDARMPPTRRRVSTPSTRRARTLAGTRTNGPTG